MSARARRPVGPQSARASPRHASPMCRMASRSRAFGGTCTGPFRRVSGMAFGRGALGRSPIRCPDRPSSVPSGTRSHQLDGCPERGQPVCSERPRSIDRPAASSPPISGRFGAAVVVSVVDDEAEPAALDLDDPALGLGPAALAARADTSTAWGLASLRSLIRTYSSNRWRLVVRISSIRWSTPPSVRSRWTWTGRSCPQPEHTPVPATRRGFELTLQEARIARPTARSPRSSTSAPTPSTPTRPRCSGRSASTPGALSTALTDLT